MNLNTQLKQFSHNFPFLPVSITVSLTQFDPFQIIQHDDPCAQQSMLFEYQDARYVSVVVKPKAIITIRNDQIKVTDRKGRVTKPQTAPLTYLNQLLQSHRVPRISGLPPFTNGLIGYFGYDFAKYAKDSQLAAAPDKLNLNDVELMQPDMTLTYDRVTKQLTVSQLLASERLVNDYEMVLKRLQKRAEQVQTMMQSNLALPKLKMITPLHNQFDLQQFIARVRQTKRHIEAGDVFQIILSNPYLGNATGALTNVGQTLLRTVTSPYHFYFVHADFQAVGASPETLIKKQGTKLFSYPLAGTRRRGRNVKEDQQFATELQNSPKELAEHNMLVDLGRNDLGQVSQFGSVHVTKLRQLLRFSNVMHLGSQIESTTDDHFTAIDIVSAVLPAGTLSGAPKQSAMQIIGALEQRKRGIYGGGIGYLDFNGDLDLCIGIRLGYKKGSQLVVHSGAGIVADSDARQEFHEFGNKSRLMLDVLKTETTMEV